MKPRTQAQAFFLTFPKNLKPVETDEVISKEDQAIFLYTSNNQLEIKTKKKISFINSIKNNKIFIFNNGNVRCTLKANVFNYKNLKMM